ncbi:hypothetical protein ACJRO7_024306 [Eucalyptus globulus]|uniref:Uncharacterized protein n=1 Tax=Eucalyptus globulus TaxID=34317 RepID=A0ABD3K979_EUCGL
MSYYPLRVVRQYRVLQEIPPPLKLGLFRFDFRDKVVKGNQIEDMKKEVENIINILHHCPPRDIEWVTELEGEMREHHASRGYIDRRIEPEVTVVIPKFPTKPTPKEIQMRRIIRERDEALAKVERLTETNKRIRKLL